MQDTIEHPEGIAAGTQNLVGIDAEVIYRTLGNFWKIEYVKMSNASNSYSDGFACKV